MLCAHDELSQLADVETELEEKMTYKDLFFHGQCEENEEVHDKDRPENRDVECLKAGARHCHQNSTKSTVPTQHTVSILKKKDER